MHLIPVTLLLVALRTPVCSAAIDTETQDIGAVEAPASSTSLLGRYADSGLDFDSWTARMVDEGHLSYPAVKADEHGVIYVRAGDEKKSWSVRIKNTACTTVHGQRDTIKRVEEHFCDWVKTAEQIWVKNKEEELMRTLCTDGQICRLGVKSTLDLTNPMKDHDDVGAMCHQLFDALLQACPDGGGVADAEVKTGKGDTIDGKIEAAFRPNHGEQCKESTSHRCVTHDEI